MTKTTRQYVFIDESGGPDISEAGHPAPSFYVIAAVLLDPAELDAAATAALELVRRHAGQGELKSKNIGSDATRRRLVLEGISQAPLYFYVLCVDKARIGTDTGLAFRRSFYKFLHKLLHERIRKAFHEMEVCADDFGSSAFMTSFERYISAELGLFGKFRFVNSAACPLLQIADVVAGSVRRAREGLDPEECLAPLSEIYLEEWPPRGSLFAKSKQPMNTGQFDELVRSEALSSIQTFLVRNAGNEAEIPRLQQFATLYLLRRFYFEPKEYVHRREICSHLEGLTGKRVSEQVLSAAVLAPIRDCGVILASTDDGVKIPYDTQDIHNYVDRVNHQVVPYLERLGAVRRTLLLASHNRYDIVTPSDFPGLSGTLERGTAAMPTHPPPG